MAAQINLAARNWAVGTYERTIDNVPANVNGVRVEVDSAEWPARYPGDPLGPLGRVVIEYSVDGVNFVSLSDFTLFRSPNPRDGVTVIGLTVPFGLVADTSAPRLNPNAVRGRLQIFTAIRTPLRLSWAVAADEK